MKIIDVLRPANKALGRFTTRPLDHSRTFYVLRSKFDFLHVFPSSLEISRDIVNTVVGHCGGKTPLLYFLIFPHSYLMSDSILNVGRLKASDSLPDLIQLYTYVQSTLLKSIKTSTVPND